MNEMLLPPGARLLHIGPHKTGTTALQIALGKNRDALLEQGVRYVWGGEHLNANLAALAVAGRPTRRFASAKPVPMEHWTSLVAKVNAAKEGERVVISGEEFCSAQEPVIERITNDLGRERLRIAITLRPIEKILVSQWQQYVQAGAVTKSLEEWVKSALDNEVSIENIKRFWMRHRHDQLVQRWVKSVGRERVDVIALDEGNRQFLYTCFEKILGVKPGSLVSDSRLINRSMTLEEAESVRAMYVLLKEQGLGDLADHVRFMISPSELIKRRRSPHPTERRIELPAWALVRARELGQEMVATIRQEGVRVIGELDWLTPHQGNQSAGHNAPTDPKNVPTTVPVDLAGWTAYGVIVSSGVARGDLPPAPTSTLPFAWLRRATGSQLMREVIRRFRIRISRPFSRLTGRNDEKAER